MLKQNINIQGLTFLIADSNAFLSSICHGILRGFGANKVIEVRSSEEAILALREQKIDLLLCDAGLPAIGGFNLTHAIRWNQACDYRTIPIMILANNTRTKMVQNARDCGANMVIAKPMSPATLYDRLSWVAFIPRKFVDAPNYFGPDRRFKIEGFPNGVGRRKGDNLTVVQESTGPALSQNEIDNLFKVTRSG
jgi:CheY-like chemotaxis protein